MEGWNGVKDLAVGLSGYYHRGMFATIAKRLARTRIAGQAIAEQTDLEPFRQRPSLRVLIGIGLITVSYLIGWPMVGVIGSLGIYLQKPWLAAIGAPAVYILSHLVFLLGMALAGAEYSLIFLKWALRTFIEKYHPHPVPAHRCPPLESSENRPLGPSL
jgi:hypothetical protein